MKNLTIDDILKCTKGTLICGNKDLEIINYSKDTRTIKNGDLYIAIKGKNFDGNKFYEDAFKKGAKAAIVDDENCIKTKENTIILVEDSVKALQDIAAYKRSLYDIPVIAITGSVGKTSTKDIITNVVSQKYKVLNTEGNQNNGIGLPFTILRLQDEEVLVLELGMNSLGEISLLSNIAKPTIGVITNIGTAHIGKLGSRENILKAKLEIIDGMKENSILIINNDNDMLNNLKINNQKIITVGINNKSDYMAQNIERYNNSSTYKLNNNKVEILIPGDAFVYNSLLAYAVGKTLNIEDNKIIAGIKTFHLAKNRLEVIKTAKQINIINDAYNANLESMKEALNFLKIQDGKRKIAVLGDILELGEFSKKIHHDVGCIVGKLKIDKLICIGDYSKYIAFSAIDEGMREDDINYFPNINEAYSYLVDNLQKDDTVLFKASNGMKLIDLVNMIKEYFNKL